MSRPEARNPAAGAETVNGFAADAKLLGHLLRGPPLVRLKPRAPLKPLEIALVFSAALVPADGVCARGAGGYGASSQSTTLATVLPSAICRRHSTWFIPGTRYWLMSG